jgi:hypothetical protein
MCAPGFHFVASGLLSSTTEENKPKSTFRQALAVIAVNRSVRRAHEYSAAWRGRAHGARYNLDKLRLRAKRDLGANASGAG